MRLAAGLLLALASCSTRPPPPAPGALTALTPVEHLTRASLALRGVRPSLAELRMVDEAPDALPEIVETYLRSADFGATIRELHDQTLMLHPQLTNFTPPPAPPLQNLSFTEMNRSIYDEPLRLIEDIVMNDRPYTEIVTADYTMADPTVATVWGLDHSDGAGWERTKYTDSRGAAGILASTALYLRYRSVAQNYNRARANAISRSLLCHDFAEADIHIDTSVNLSDPAVVADAVVHNPSCAGCHQAMDPLASYFWPFLQGTMNSVYVPQYPVEWYQSKDAGRWFVTTMRPPGYFGQELSSTSALAGLGQAIAADPRFARCAVTHFASYLTEIPARDLSPAWIAELQQAFVASNYNARALARHIVLSDEFQTASAGDPVVAEGVIGYQKLRPQQLGRMLRDLTGFVWEGDPQTTINLWRFGRANYLDDDYVGFRVLAGGTDGWYVTEPSHTVNATTLLVARRAAALAADYVVHHDADAALADRVLFARTDPRTSDEAAVRKQLVDLHGRIYGELLAPDDPRIDDTLALFRGALDANNGDPVRAWIVTLTGMLSDLRSLYY